MKFLVINRAQDTDRLMNVENQFKFLDREFHRISAVEGRDLKPADSLIPNPSVAACWYSHKQAYEMLISSGENSAIILEDDFSVLDRRRFLNQISRISSSDFEIVQLGYLTHGVLEKLQNFNFYCRQKLKMIFLKQRSVPGIVLHDFLAGSHCYYITSSAARKLATLNSPVAIPVDGFLQGVVRSQSIRGGRVGKSLVRQNDGISTISGKNVRR